MSKFKLTFQLVLPITQLLLALALLEAGRQVTQPTGLNFPYAPTPILICKGISAPATLFAAGLSLLPLERLNRTPTAIFGLGAQELIFLFGVIILWFFVGRAIDSTKRGQGSFGPKAGAAKSTIDIMLMLLATLVLMVGVTPILDTRGFTNPTGARAAAFLWLAWFLVLFFVPGIDLVRRFRARGSHA